MSRHHRAQKHTTHLPKRRREIEARLPLPCLNCPHPVMPEHSWQVGHIVDAMDGGTSANPNNVGPSHAFCPWCRKRCNQVAGGRRGAAVTNGRRRASLGRRVW